MSIDLSLLQHGVVRGMPKGTSSQKSFLQQAAEQANKGVMEDTVNIVRHPGTSKMMDAARTVAKKGHGKTIALGAAITAAVIAAGAFIAKKVQEAKANKQEA